MISGGYNGSTIRLSNTEIYDPSTENWTGAASMLNNRYRFAGVLLDDGRVLAVAGGSNGSTSLKSSEIYDPALNTWTSTGELSAERSDNVAVKLDDGTVMALGDLWGMELTELYDPDTGVWSSAGNLMAARAGFAATLLADRRVLVTGGYDGVTYLSSAEAYSPGDGPGADAAIELRFGAGNGTFGPAIITTPQSSGNEPGPQKLTVGDFNWDGLLDVAVSSHNNSTRLEVLLNDGDGTFTTSYYTDAVWFSSRELTVADFDKDGLQDILIHNDGQRDWGVFTNNGDDSFTRTAFGRNEHSFSHRALLVADFDNDSDMDFGAAGDGHVTMRWNDGTGQFGPKWDGAWHSGLADFSGASTIDFNSDGHMDMVIYGGTEVLLKQGDGAGGFADTVFDVGVAGTGLTTVDFNGDGLTDILLTGDAAELLLLTADGGGGFLPPQSIALPFVGSSMPAIADFNNDGLQDVAVVSSIDTVKVLLSYGDVPGLFQMVAGESNVAAVTPGSDVIFDVMYRTSNGDETLSGLGLRMHWDSSMLTYDSLSQVFAGGLQPLGDPQMDTADYDGDPDTDWYLTVFWIDLGGNWPGEGAAPQKLFTANLAATESFANSTTVNFTASSTAAGYEFQGSPVEISEMMWNLDIDDSGTADALTDGIMIIRHLAGLPAEAVVQDAVDPGATRTDPQQIADYTRIIHQTLTVDSPRASAGRRA